MRELFHAVEQLAGRRLVGRIDKQCHAPQRIDDHERSLVAPRLGSRIGGRVGAHNHVGQREHFRDRFVRFLATLPSQRERRVKPHIISCVAGQLPESFDGSGPAEHAEREGRGRPQLRVVALRGGDHRRGDASGIVKRATRRHEVCRQHGQRFDRRAGRLWISEVLGASHQRTGRCRNGEFAQGTAEIESEGLRLLTAATTGRLVVEDAAQFRGERLV